MPNFSARRLALCGVLAAMFFALSLLSVEVGGIKLTLDALPVVVAAMLLGPADALLVGLVGALLEQLLRYGFTATTVLWILPPACRGLIVALAARRGAASLRSILETKKPARYFAVCVLAGVAVSCGNTLVYWLDSVVNHYYSFALIFGVLWIRILSGVATSVLTAAIALPILSALSRKSGGAV